MSTTQTEREVPTWRRLLVAAGWFALLIVLVSGGVFLFNRHRLTSQLERVMKELDENDPGWRWEEILAGRPEIRPEENSAPRILDIVRDLPRGWPDDKRAEALRGLPSNVVLDEPRRKILDDLLAQVPALRPRARGLVRLPRGRFDIELREHPWTTLVPDHQRTRAAANLLLLDGFALSLDGQHGEALRAAHACLNVSRSLEDDPVLIVQIIRIALGAIAMGMVERAMALGDAPDDALAALQKELEHEAARTRMTAALRGERAGVHQVVTLLTAGKLPMTEIDDPEDWSWGLRWLAPFTVREMARREHADLLRVMTKMVDSTRLPARDQFAAEDDIEKQVSAPSAGRVMRSVIPAYAKMTGAGRRAQCYAVAMRALIAVERYRLKHGKWPDKLEDTVPAFLEKVPLDPIDGAPIRYKRWAEGVVVYSIGNDRTDDGGEVGPPLKDFGHRLWDPDKRRAAPPPLPPDVPEDGGPGAPP